MKASKRRGQGNRRTPLINGIVLAGISAYLCVYLSLNGMWNVATVFVVLLLLAISASMFMIYFKFFREK